MTVDSLKIVEVVGIKVVELSYVILLSYIAKLASGYLHYRLSVTGKPVFESKPEEIQS